MKHSISDLNQMQSLSLQAKIQMTRQRVKGWVTEYGEDGVYISFSGGKDSTVLLDIVRADYPDVPAVFVDVPTQYPELRAFAQSFENVIILKPKMSFMQVCERYGFPLVSKEVSERVYYAHKYIDWYRGKGEYKSKGKRKRPTSYGILELSGERTDRNTTITDDVPEGVVKEILSTSDLYKIREMLGISTQGNGEKSRYNYSKWLFLAGAPFSLSNQCCKVMKKAPLHAYDKESGKWPFTAEMASESMQRRGQWLQHGCNAFDLKTPKSMPMAFWTEQDVLQYIYENNLPICSVYGDVIRTEAGTYKTTGCKRTGCMLCGFGCHREHPGEGRFELLKQTHPGMYRMLDVVKNNGYTMRQAIDWLNEHGNTNIKY